MDNKLLIIEWLDKYIPPRRHFLVAPERDAARMVCDGTKRGWDICAYSIFPELLREETAPRERQR